MTFRSLISDLWTICWWKNMILHCFWSLTIFDLLQLPLVSCDIPFHPWSMSNLIKDHGFTVISDLSWAVLFWQKYWEDNGATVPPRSSLICKWLIGQHPWSNSIFELYWRVISLPASAWSVMAISDAMPYVFKDFLCFSHLEFMDNILIGFHGLITSITSNDLCYVMIYDMLWSLSEDVMNFKMRNIKRTPWQQYSLCGLSHEGNPPQ